MTASPSVRRLAILATALAAGHAAPALATENGQVRALLGAPSYELATPQFPGLYGQLWYQHYNANTLRDNNGDDVARSVTVPGVGTVPVKVKAKVRADVIVPRLTLITDQLVADGRLGFSVALPVVEQTTTVSLSSAVPALAPTLDAAGASQSGRTHGQADIELSSFVDWQGEESRFAAGFAVNAPTGEYNKDRAVNIGTGNYWTVKPLIVASRVFENGLQLGARGTYSINTKNRDTEVRSGQYVHVDWAAVVPVAEQWRVGVQGFVLKQTTKDRGPDVSEDGNKVQTLGLGPTLAYLSEDGIWALDAKVMKEFEVRNRPEGYVSWLRLNVRLD